MFVEQGGPVAIVGGNGTIIDADQYVQDHKRVDTVCIAINQPLPGDQLVFDGSLNLFNETNTSSCINFSGCDNSFNSSCFNNLLMGVRFNNSEDEPNLSDRTITFTVSYL